MKTLTEITAELVEIKNQIGDVSAMSPRQAQDLNVALALLQSDIAHQIRATELGYNEVLLECFKKEGKKNRAELVASITPEYAEWSEARDLQYATEQLSRALGKIIKVAENEEGGYRRM